MALQQDSLSTRIALADGEAGKKTPPSEFRIFASGLFDTTKGPFLFDLDGAASVMRCAGDYGNELNVDYNHGQADSWPVDPSLAGKSAGWFGLEVRNGELWAINVRWTPAAHAAIAAGEWRYISPWFSFDGETRRIHELHNVALTNTPATKHLKPLTASRLGQPLESPDMLPKSILSRLGLADTASEADVLNALASREALNTAATAQKPQVDEVLSLAGAASLSAALGTLKAWKESHEALPSLKAELSTVKAEKSTAELSALLDEATKAGKVAPAEREHLTAWGKASLDGLKAYLAAKAPVVVKDEKKPAEGGVDTSSLSAEELSVAKATGLTPAEFARAKAERAARA